LGQDGLQSITGRQEEQGINDDLRQLRQVFSLVQLVKHVQADMGDQQRI
jgi:hypothetical protein